MYFMVRWRGYVVANKGGHGRKAMRVRKTHSSKGSAIKYVREKTDDHMSMNFPERNKGFSFGAYPVESEKSRRFPAGREGNNALLEWHDSKTGRKVSKTLGIAGTEKIKF